jgi:Ca2+-binding RTX toxin-like protein
VLGKNTAGLAFFERVGLDGQAVGQFNLVVDTAEIFDVSGEGGNDTFIVNDLTGTGVDLIQFDGGAGNDLLDARNSSTRVEAVGGEGDDTLIGGTGTIVGANNVTLGDTLTGGLGKDKFQFSTNPFANGNPAANLNQPDVITDYEIGVDQIVLDKLQTGINELKFQNGLVDQLSGDNNMLVLQGSFANAGAAAAAIKNNQNITAGKGAFSYYNNTLGISRVVFSQDLANGGTFSVQANLTNLTSAAEQVKFTAADFGLV